VDPLTVAVRHPPEAVWSLNEAHDDPLNQSRVVAAPGWQAVRSSDVGVDPAERATS
jgi:hypothetical protein